MGGILELRWCQAKPAGTVQRGWLLAIASLKGIAKESIHGLQFRFLLTGRFNQDCVEVQMHKANCQYLGFTHHCIYAHNSPDIAGV